MKKYIYPNVKKGHAIGCNRSELALMSVRIESYVGM